MPSPDELRAHIAEGRAALKSAIQTSGDRWEQTIPGDDWSPRKAAEHAIGAEVYFASEVCSACGYPGLDPWTGSYATPADAIAGLDRLGVGELAELRILLIALGLPETLGILPPVVPQDAVLRLRRVAPHDVPRLFLGIHARDVH